MSEEINYQMGEEQIQAIDEFQDGILDLIQNMGEREVPPEEVIFQAVRIFSELAFDMAPSEEVARKTIEVSVEEAYKNVFEGGREPCPKCAVKH